MGKIKSLFKTKWIWIAVTIIVVVISVFGIHNVGYSKGQDSLTAEVNKELLNYEQIQEKVGEAEQTLVDVNNKIETAESDLKTIEEKVAKNQDELDKLQELASNRDGLETDISQAENTLSTIKQNIESKTEELQSLTGKLQKAEGKPLKLEAGHYVVGNDLPIGRYKITPTQGSGNVFIDSGSGEGKVSETLGPNPDYHLSSYVFFAENGDTMELNVPVTFTPVE
ncbi:coiled-coil domain-containing protein [Virgibacillus litoralis]|uniref:RND superfamily exporter protein n=1 Tax=Virgibacillus litoralis TaxID=578221 RepID=A0ABS4HHV9_9BACI|nr:hypothetical protein [Virgibacillus litoralis]MBP1950314.1 putative RND superfamily exporter protein [Virgibacillus litoralis]